jgi:uncharacterized protein with NAD-binding domain and iron-sulfur cluster
MGNSAGKRVAILGGGVAGLSAAHELAERGFEVEVYERQPLCGGKARSIPVLPALGDHGGKRTQALAARYWREYSSARAEASALRPWVPGEHGFRFFPSFYRHIIDTMERIPFGKGTVAGNMANTTQVLMARYDQAGIVTTASFPRTLEGVQLTINNFLQLLSGQFGVPPDEIDTLLHESGRSSARARNAAFTSTKRWAGGNLSARQNDQKGIRNCLATVLRDPWWPRRHSAPAREP